MVGARDKPERRHGKAHYIFYILLVTHLMYKIVNFYSMSFGRVVFIIITGIAFKKCLVETMSRSVGHPLLKCLFIASGKQLRIDIAS